MSEVSTYYSNVERFSRMCPQAAKALDAIDPSHLEFTHTIQGELNLKTAIAGKDYYYHNQSGALQEAKEWWEEAFPIEMGVVCLYGLGLGYHYDALKEWLEFNPGRYLVFLEDDLCLLKRFLETERAAKILQDPQVVVHYFKMPHEREWGQFRLDFRWFTYPFSSRKVCFDALKFYKQIKGYAFDLVSNQLKMNMRDIGFYLAEYFGNQALVSRNTYTNVFYLIDSINAHSLVEKFWNIPAIICGAGPSISKHLDQLAVLSEKAIIFGSGTGLNLISRQGIMPNFGVCIDPYDVQESRFMSQLGYQTHFFFFPRFFHKAAKLLLEPLLFAPSFGKPYQWLFKELGYKPEKRLDEGISSSNLCCSIAIRLGCNPIVLTGLDMAYTNADKYAQGVGSHPGDDQRHKQQITEKSDQTFKVKDANQKDVNTTWEWIVEAGFFSEMAEKNPGISFINSTEGGMPILEVPNFTLKKVVEERLKNTFDIQNWIHCEMQRGHRQNVTYDGLYSLLSGWLDSLNTCLQYFEQLEDYYKSIENQLAQGNVISQEEESDAEKGLWNSIKKEAAYKNLMKPHRSIFKLLVTPEINKLKFFPEQYPPLKRAYVLLERKKGYLNFLKNLIAIHKDSLLQALKEQEELNRETQSSKEIPEQPIVHENETYQFSENILKIVDLELDLNIQEGFSPELINTEKVHTNDKPINTFIYPHADIQEGQALLFDEMDKVKGESYYKKGVLHGPSSFYSQAGQLIAKAWFYNGKRVGKSWQYYPSGRVYSLQRYVNGVQHLKQEYFYQNGQPKMILNYHLGRLHGEIQFFFPNGKLWRKQNFYEGKLHGKELMYSHSGERILEAEYKENLPTGRTKTWHPNGKLAKEIIFHNNPLNFDLYMWDEQGKLIHKQIAIPDSAVNDMLNKSLELQKSLEKVSNLIDKLKEDEL